MSTSVVSISEASKIENVLVNGDLKDLPIPQRLVYYQQLCASLGLNPLTKPFAYITLNSKLVLYALKDCTEQLRNIRGVSLQIPSREVLEGVYVVTARATLPNGRQDESTGAVTIESLKGEARANAMMKAETKAKRRVTLSICGLGMLDETEIETIPNAKHPPEEVRDRRLAEERAKANPATDPTELHELMEMVRTLTPNATETLLTKVNDAYIDLRPDGGDIVISDEWDAFVKKHPKKGRTPQDYLDYANHIWRKVAELGLLGASADSTGDQV